MALNTLTLKLQRFLVAGLLVLASISSFAAELFAGNFQQIFQAKSDELVIWQYADNQNIYVFDFPGLNFQGGSFNRATQFTEQRFVGAPYPKVLNDDELAAHIAAARRNKANFAFGHDFLVSELVQFFNFALRDKIELNSHEIAVRDFLIKQMLVREFRGFYQAIRPDVVIISVPQTQERKTDEPMISSGARYAILLHEMSHAEFYSNPHYAKFCERFWNEKLTEQQRELFRKFLHAYNYFIEDQTLVVNEMQAYLMFTPDPKSFNHRRLGVSEEELEAMRSAFRRSSPPIRLPLTLMEGL